MAFFPRSDFSFNTHLSPLEVERRLAEITEPKTILHSFVGSPDSRKSYIGTVKDNKFRLEQIKGVFRTASLPIIEGSIKPYLNGSSVEVKFRTPLHAKILELIGLGVMASLLSVFFIISQIAGGNNNFFILPGTMFILSLLASPFIRKYERNKLKAFLTEQLKAYNP